MPVPGLTFDRMDAVDGQKDEIDTRCLAKRLPNVEIVLAIPRERGIIGKQA